MKTVHSSYGTVGTQVLQFGNCHDSQPYVGVFLGSRRIRSDAESFYTKIDENQPTFNDYSSSQI